MQATIRTTVRLRKDLFEHSRMLAFEKGISLQEVINQSLAIGYKHLSDLQGVKHAMMQIDDFRNSLIDKDIDIKKLVEKSKNEQK